MTLPLENLLVSQLQWVLDQELEHGNSVKEVTDWPPKCELLVILQRPFHKSYLPLMDVEFASINDTHYWKDECRFHGGKQVIAGSSG